jgi:autotransporter adhesin
MTIETKSQFAKRISRAPSYITELIGHGRLVLTADGKKIEVEASLEKLAQTASGAKPAVAARHEAERKGQKPARKSRKVAEIVEGSRQYYERSLQQIKNDHKALEFDLVLGKRFLIADVRREAQALGNTLRASLERLVDQTAPRLAVTQDAVVRNQILLDEIKNLNRVIKAEFPRAMRRLRKG